MTNARQLNHTEGEWASLDEGFLHFSKAEHFVAYARVNDSWYYFYSSNEPIWDHLDIEVGEVKVICHEDYKTKVESIFAASQLKIKTFTQYAEIYLLQNGRIKVNVPQAQTVAAAKVATSSQSHKKKIKKIYIVDDSKVIRKIIRGALEDHAEFEVVGECADPLEALEKLRDTTFEVDAMTVDIHMPSMIGGEFLDRLYEFRYIPSVIVSSLSLKEGTKVLDALEAGAIDYIQKPTLDEIDNLKDLLYEKLSIAAAARKNTVESNIKVDQSIYNGVQFNPNKVILIGASTGGTEAIRDVLIQLPANIPPIVIVQHIPPYFSKAFADRLNDLCTFKVREAKDGDVLEAGHAYVAPGGLQMKIINKNRPYSLKVEEGEKVSGHKPSVNVMFHSIEKTSAKNIVALLLTGMGSDGAKGLKQLRDFGAHTIAQDEESSVVYGMPKAAVQLNAHKEICALEDLADLLVRRVKL